MFDIVALIKTVGYFGVFGIIFAESGLLIGFFLPGDSLLFTAGFLASQDYLNIWILVTGSVISAILGDNVGYAFGKKIGVKIFTKEDSLFFHKDNIKKTQDFFEKHGPKALILARFVPIVRTFTPILAGVGTMEYKVFFLYNVVGGILWAFGLPMLGFTLGNLIPDIDKYLLPIILLIIFVSVLPNLIHIYKDERLKQAIITKIKSIFVRSK